MPKHPLHQPILAWYAANARDLPWRRPQATAWGVLVSEIMLQQTPVNRVLPVWHEWIQRWPTPADLAAEPAAEAIRAWGRLGYPRRALRLHEAAVVIAQQHGGAVPDDYQALRALPGVGEYTAAAVASFAFGQRHAVVDTNVRRVHARAISGKAQAAPTLTAAERDLAAAILPDAPDAAATWAVAVMELGALICVARSPDCLRCPILSRCQWQRNGAPPDDGPARRSQKYVGTDRYVRGLLLAALRASNDALSAQELQSAAPAEILRDPGQRDRCLGSLIVDGLVEPTAEGRFRLPLAAGHTDPPELATRGRACRG